MLDIKNMPFKLRSISCTHFYFEAAGRSLLVISPEDGPLHRLVVILTEMPLDTGKPVPNQCGDCSSCVDECPVGALTLTTFDDHPLHREDVLDNPGFDRL
jgi:ferredoxin